MSTSVCHLCRAYKLGKGRWSYNRCSLTLRQAMVDDVSAVKTTASPLSVAKAAVDSGYDDQPEDQVGVLKGHWCDLLTTPVA